MSTTTSAHEENVPVAEKIATNLPLTQGRENIFAYKLMAVQDATYYSTDKSLWQPANTYQAVRPYYIQHYDVPPKTARVDFGCEIKFDVGHEGPAGLQRMDILFALPPLTKEGDQVNGVDVHGKWNWQNWIGEQLLGPMIQLRYGQNCLRKYSSYAWHINRRIHDVDFVTESNAYKEAVGADQDNVISSRTQTLVVPIWMPLHEEHGAVIYSSALPSTMEVSFSIPDHRDLITRRPANDTDTGVHNLEVPANADDTSVVPFPEKPEGLQVLLRATYVEFQKTERSTYVMVCTTTDGGLLWNIHDLEVQDNNLLSFRKDGYVRSLAGVGDNLKTKQFRVPLTNFKNPLSAMFLASRYEVDKRRALEGQYDDDAKSPEAINALGDEDGFAPAVLERIMSSTSNGRVFCPQRFGSEVPIAAAWLEDASQRITNVFTAKEQRINTLSRLTQMSLGTNILMIPFSEFPLVAKHACGHLTISSMYNPQLVVEQQYRPGDGFEETSAAYDPWCRQASVNVNAVDGETVVTNPAAVAAGYLDKDMYIIGLSKNQIQHARGELVRVYC